LSPTEYTPDLTSPKEKTEHEGGDIERMRKQTEILRRPLPVNWQMEIDEDDED